jgi:chromosome segregation protein
MYLKNLTVFGFKSFADKTSLNFLPGITAVVGPNGCGKSNVADAVRWVLGEQSAKALRGGEMADVIFNGTDARKPLGMAEVSLTIGDVDAEHLKAAGVEMAFNEVTLTRRVFRDGGSEYFINRVACRLKDIQQLFMGTGVGRTSYSIMAQGNITQILSSRPEDRRLVFEEAAGITKYKSQKKESLRKLDYTEQNLLRISDLIREVKRQIGSLQRQAGKARRFKALAADLQHLETQLSRHQYDVLQAGIGERQAVTVRLKGEIEAASDAIARGESEVETLRGQHAGLDATLTEALRRGQELKSEVERHESRVHFNEERIREIGTQNEKALADIAQAEERRQIAEAELAAVKERLSASLASLQELRKNLTERQASLQGVERELSQRQEHVRQAQAEAFAAAQQLTRVRNQINALDMQRQGNVVRLEKLAAEKIQTEEERARLEVRLREFAANVEMERNHVQTRRGTVEERQQRLRQLQVELGQVAQELDSKLRLQAEKHSRLNVLEQLQAGHEGFSAGALAALKGTEHVLGSLADRIRVPDEFIGAVDAALGHHLQLVLTEQPDAAERIVADLRTHKKGRASIGALSMLVADADAEPPQPEPAFTQARPILSVIEAEPSVQPLLRSLLRNTYLVSDLAAATASWREGRGGFDFVTVQGELLTHHGIYTGGSGGGAANGKTAASILGRRNQISELQGALAALHQEVAEVSRRKGAMQGEQTELQASLQQAQLELRAHEVAVATRQGEFNALQNSLKGLLQKVQTISFEITSLTSQEREGTEKRGQAAAQADELERREQAAQDRLTDLNTSIDALRHQKDAATSALNEVRVALASEEQLGSAHARQKAPLEQRIREVSQLASQRQGEIAGALQRRDTATAEITASRARIEALSADREQAGVLASDLARQKEALEAELAGREARLRDDRRRIALLQEQRGVVEVELAQKQMAVQNLREKVLQKYQVDLDSVRSECITITIVDEGPAKVKTLTPDEMSQAGVATDWDAVEQQISAIQKRIDEIGPVNLVAIEEYEETEQRYQFLSKQYDDLVEAKQQLVEVIQRINTQTREMFVETFNKIRDNFQVMFTEIFGGGKADLRLVEEGDVLESGIEIVARPPGKQLQNITLLSGGEQTMTAVALLFAIYQVKPSPFCVLDELDAPLDESNINRFIRILQRFLAHSQFIIITHNKRTIGVADVLYGVTMQEQGVSKLVSVKFHRTGDAAGDRAPVPLVPPPAVKSVDAEEDRPQRPEDTLEFAIAK